MGLVAEVLVLSLLTVSCFTTVFSEETEALAPHYHGRVAPATAPTHHHHHHHPPSQAPTHHHHHHHHGYPPVHPPMLSPTHPPMHPPTKPTTKPPTYPPTKPQPPMKPPMKPPTKPVHPPVQPPLKPPAHPPVYHFPRSFVAVQGVVYCKSCKYAGVDTLLGATPVLGATVKLQCNNTNYPTVVQAKTDKNGYFFLQGPKTITTYGAHKCKAFLVSAPSTACSKPSDFHGGYSGATLRPEKPFVSNKLPFFLYTVGPFAFEPKCPR